MTIDPGIDTLLARLIKTRDVLDRAIQGLTPLSNGGNGSAPVVKQQKKRKKRAPVSAQGRENIRLGQLKRWGKTIPSPVEAAPI